MAATRLEERRGVVRNLRRWATWVADRALGWVFLRLHRRYRVGGMTVILSDTSAAGDLSLQRIGSALDTLRSLDPARAARVGRWVKHVIVWPGHYTAYDKWGGIHLASRHLAAPPVILASALVHEATHLRIAKRGIPYDPARRARIEKLCVQEQAAFLRKAPIDGPRWADQVEQGLNEPWWTEADREARVHRSLQEAQLPDWLAPLLFRPQK